MGFVLYLYIIQEEVEPYYEAFACLAKSIRDDQEFQARALSLNAYYSVAELYNYTTLVHI